MINTADEKSTPGQDLIKGVKENIKGFMSDVQSRRMSMLGVREKSTRGVLSKDGLMKGKGIASDGQGLVAKFMAMIPRPFGLLKPPAETGGNGTGTGEGTTTGGDTNGDEAASSGEPTMVMALRGH